MNALIIILFFLHFSPVGACVYSLFYLIHQGILGKMPLSWKYWGMLLFGYGGNIFFLTYAYMKFVYDFAFFPQYGWLNMVESWGIFAGWLLANYILCSGLEGVKRAWERIGHTHHKQYEYIKNLPIVFGKKYLLFGIGWMLFLIFLMTLRFYGYI